MEKLSLTEISNAIRTYQAGKGETEAFAIANAFIRSMNAGMDCAVLIQNQVVNGKKVQGFAMLRDKAGHKVFPLFTNMNEMTATKNILSKQGDVQAGVMKLKSVIEMLAAKTLCEGIIVDPVGLKFNAPIGFYKEILKRNVSSHITLMQADITSLYTDAIVSATDENISGTCGVDMAIQQAGGDALTDLITEDKIDVADVFAARSGGKLHSKLVLFTRGPEYKKDMKVEELMECYLNCLSTAKELQCLSIAFPCIGAEKNIPMEIIVAASTKAVTTWLGANKDYNMDVYFCCENKEQRDMYQKLFNGVQK